MLSNADLSEIWPFGELLSRNKSSFCVDFVLVKTLIATKSEHLTFANTGKERTGRKLNRIRIAVMN